MRRAGFAAAVVVLAGCGGPEMSGPEHGGSTYRRPGDEWGSGYRFAKAGCYRLTARRTVGRADVWLRIRA